MSEIKRNTNHLWLILVGIICFLLFPQQIHANDIDVVSSVSANKIGIEDSFYYTILVETSSNKRLNVDIKLENFPADYLRPNISNSSSTSFINGKMSSSRSQTHKYTVYPKQEGILDIPQIEVIVNGEKFKTSVHKVQVVSGSLRPQRNTRARSRSPFGSLFDNDWDDGSSLRRQNNDSFIEVELSNDSVYVGQNITAKYTFYTLNNNNSNISFDMQSFDGYGIESSETTNKNWQRVKRKGKNYYSLEVTTMNISPQQSGLLTLPIVVVNVNMFITSNSFKSPNKQLMVKALPKKGKAIDYSNAIGEFTVEAELTQGIMYENQQNQLILTIKGRGNFQKILYPEIQKVDGLEILKPKATLDFKDEDKGTLLLTYDIIPSESGKFNIPSISFNFFNDKKGKYQTIYTKSNLLTVKMIDIASASSSYNGHNTFYSKNKPYLGNINSEYLITSKFSYWLLLGFFVFSMIAYLIFYNIQENRMSNVGYVRRREALNILKKALAESEKLVESKDINFYTNAQNNLLKFISKITRASLQLSQPELIAELEKSSVNKVTAAKINSFLTYCEQIKYRPDFQSNENIRKDYQKFQDIYNEIRNG